MTEPAGMEASSFDEVDLCGFHRFLGIWCPWLDFLWISSILYDFWLIFVDFIESRRPVSGGIWRPVAACGGLWHGSRGPKETLQSWNLHSDD